MMTAKLLDVQRDGTPAIMSVCKTTEKGKYYRTFTMLVRFKEMILET